MAKIQKALKPKPPIDEEYFTHYAGRRRSYRRIWRDHTFVEECIEQFKAPGAPRLKSVCVLGAATGEVPREFARAFGILPHGCEISPWAHAKIPAPYRRRIRRADMRDYVRKLVDVGRRFDLVYTNSLIYLKRAEIPKFLRQLSRLGRYLHFNSSFKGAACPDPYRQTLESYAWWNRKLRRAGFVELKTASGARTYLWENRAKL